MSTPIRYGFLGRRRLRRGGASAAQRDAFAAMHLMPRVAEVSLGRTAHPAGHTSRAVRRTRCASRRAARCCDPSRQRVRRGVRRGGRFVPRNERARLMRACRSARVDFSRVLTVGSAGATALPSSRTQTSIGRAAQDPQSRCAQRAEAASVCSGLRRDAEHAFDRTSRMPGSRGWVTKPAWCRSAHLAANGAALPRRETAATGAPNAIKVRGACAARVRDAAHARCETHITGSRHARSKCATRPIRDATQPLALCLDRSDAERDRRRSVPVTERVGLHVRLRAEQPYEASDRLSAKRDTNSANAGDFSYTPIHFVATVFRAMLRIKSDAPCMLSRPADRHFSVCEAPKSDR